MSYILDAIRKAEQERQKQQAPELMQIQAAPAGAAAPKRNWLPWLALVALVVLLTVVLNIWFLQTRSDKDTAPTVVVQAPAAQSSTTPSAPAANGQQAANGQHSASGQHVVNGQAAAQQPISAAASSATSAGTSASLSSPPDAVMPAAGRVPLWQAPAQAKAAIGALQFSFHVYSDNPARRTIIINRKRMREGQQISSDLLLQGIDEQGVVIAWQDLLVEVPVLEQW